MKKLLLVFCVILLLTLSSLEVMAAPREFTPEIYGECGDDTCDEDEDADSCPSDCSTFIVGYCGDGICSEGEESSCAEDCGIDCIEQTCADGEYFDTETCSCQPTGDSCLPQTCPANQIFDTNLCKCVDTAYCGNGTCDADENTENCAQDCGTPIPLTYCGDGNCDADENHNSCSQDCPPPDPEPITVTSCGDGTCDASTENYKSCPNDCPAPANNCGDGFCDLASENPTTCPKDCENDLCGNGTCDISQGEDSFNCSIDCTELRPYVCGDEVCETNLLESHSNCPSDCLVTCGNGTCEYIDTGAEPGMMNQGLQPVQETRENCPSDCVPSCGNKKCEISIGENHSNCPGDCPAGNTAKTEADQPNKCKNYSGPGYDFGYKPLDCPADCGNGVCDTLYGETPTNCQLDCKTVCGDYRCDLDAGETTPNCPKDCAPTCGDRICDHTKETVISCPSDCPLTALKCGDEKCEPGEAIACPECWDDRRCDFGEGTIFRVPDCSIVYPGCSCYEWTARHSLLPGNYQSLTALYSRARYSIPISPLLLVGAVVFMRNRRIKR